MDGSLLPGEEGITVGKGERAKPDSKYKEKAFLPLYTIQRQDLNVGKDIDLLKTAYNG